MSILFYYADPEKMPPEGGQFAQMGFGFSADGALRLPVRPQRDALCVLDDRVLPEHLPELTPLRPYLKNGVFCDLERTVCARTRALLTALRTIRPENAPLFLPERACEGQRDVVPVVSVLGIPNCWERFCQDASARCGGAWALELIPARQPCALPCRARRAIPNACCMLENGRYFDTRATLLQKARAAERFGCTAVFVLRQEFARLAR